MSWIDRLLRRKPNQTKYAPSLGMTFPAFAQFGSNIYASDVVQQALRCIVDEIKKLIPMHVRYIDGDPTPVKGSLQKVLDEPNPLMTKSEFLEKTTWLLLMNYNVFIMPVYYTWTDKKTGEERRRYEALYPLKPIEVDFIEDASGRLFVHMWFSGGYDTTVPYDDLIHIRMNYSVNDYMGGDETGNPNFRPLLKTLGINEELLNGVAKAMKASYAINGVIKYNTLMDDGKTEAALAELEEKLRNNESGFLPLDIKADFTPLPHESALVDDKTLKFIDEKILRSFGVPLCILTGDFTPAQYEAFYQKTLEPIATSMSQAFTKRLFTENERAFGNQVKLYPKDLIFMTMDQTLRMIELLSNTGAIFENEKRTALGLRPLPELKGKRYTSLNWINADDAKAYQIGDTDSGEEKEEQDGEA